MHLFCVYLKKGGGELIDMHPPDSRRDGGTLAESCANKGVGGREGGGVMEDWVFVTAVRFNLLKGVIKIINTVHSY